MRNRAVSMTTPNGVTSLLFSVGIISISSGFGVNRIGIAEAMDLVIRNARLVSRLDEGPLDIAVEDGRIAAIGPGLAGEGETYDAGGRLVCAGLIESHIHLDKSRIAESCPLPEGRRVNSVTMVAPLKPGWTVEDIYQRAETTLGECLVNGTTHMRTQVEIDPGIG